MLAMQARVNQRRQVSAARAASSKLASIGFADNMICNHDD
jgi:hypothetical protein